MQLRDLHGRDHNTKVGPGINGLTHRLDPTVTTDLQQTILIDPNESSQTIVTPRGAFFVRSSRHEELICPYKIKVVSD